MKRSIIFLPLVAVCLFMTSCVTKKQYAGLESDYKQLQKNYQKAQLDLTESRANAKSLEELYAKVTQLCRALWIRVSNRILREM